jgi:Phosphotransferase enzyme family
MVSAVRAATDVARQYGITAADPVLVQETNNTVVWLRPLPVIAKVAVRADSQDDIRREYEIAVELATRDAAVGRPLPGVGPSEHSDTGFVVTLWERLEGSDRAAVPPGELARSLRQLHVALGQTKVALPSFRSLLAKAQLVCENGVFLASLPQGDRDLLHDSYDRGFAALDGFSFKERRLHGEPHDGNRIATGHGLRWIDFESVCRGPLEWDLAFQSDETVTLFPEADIGLLRVLRRLNSARVATWCLGSRHPEMQAHGDLHLANLRQFS